MTTVSDISHNTCSSNRSPNGGEYHNYDGCLTRTAHARIVDRRSPVDTSHSVSPPERCGL
jgi:hypothetical protein